MIVVDKTGTLTQGRPKLTECLPVDSGSDDELLRMAASLERQSEHPLARAIVEGAQDRSLELSAVDDFNSITGGGVRGSVGETKVLIGNRPLLESHGAGNLSALDEQAVELQQRGRTVMYVALACESSCSPVTTKNRKDRRRTTRHRRV